MRELILNLFFPKGASCLICGDPRRADEADSLCDDCRKALESEKIPASACNICLSDRDKNGTCAFCKAGGMQYLDRAYAPYRYWKHANTLIKAVKFEGVDDGLPVLWDALENALADRDFDLIVPVPLHKYRFRERGVNQAMLLCNGLSQRVGIPAQEILVRLRATKAQSSLKKRKSRRENVRDAFMAMENVSLSGKKILLVDDVRTSGSTARECAKALRKAGAVKVSLCTVCAVGRYRGE